MGFLTLHEIWTKSVRYQPFIVPGPARSVVQPMHPNRPNLIAVRKLKESGLRPTRQRVALARLLLETGPRHVTAEELFQEARAAGIPVSLATVYNTLHQFTAAGLMTEVVAGSGQSYFDTNPTSHYHYFDKSTGEISKPVETKFGVHIIKLIAKYPPGDLPKEALVEQIRERLSQRKLHQGRRDLKEALLARYKVENKMEEALGPDPRAKKGMPGPGGNKLAPGAGPQMGSLPPDHPPIGDGSVQPKNGPTPGLTKPNAPPTGPDSKVADEPKGGDADGGDGE